MCLFNFVVIVLLDICVVTQTVQVFDCVSDCKSACMYPESSGHARPLSNIHWRGWDQCSPGPDRSGKSALKAITSFEMQSFSKIFSWKRHLKHVLREKEETQIRKKILKFPIVLHITSSALQFYEMFCIYILLYSMFLCIYFSIRFFNSSAKHVSFNQTLQS